MMIVIVKKQFFLGWQLLLRIKRLNVSSGAIPGALSSFCRDPRNLHRIKTFQPRALLSPRLHFLEPWIFHVLHQKYRKYGVYVGDWGGCENQFGGCRLTWCCFSPRNRNRPHVLNRDPDKPKTIWRWWFITKATVTFAYCQRATWAPICRKKSW